MKNITRVLGGITNRKIQKATKGNERMPEFHDEVLAASQDSSPQPEVLAPTVDEVPTPQGFLLHLGKILMSFF